MTPRGDEPLLARRPSSDLSRERETAAEEDALLTGIHTKGNIPRHTWRRWRELGAWIWAVLATIVVVALAVMYERARGQLNRPSAPSGKRNLIFMVSDGMGPTSLALTRSYRQHKNALPWGDALMLDSYIVGQSRTRSTSSLITDSAAGATAFSCGKKSYNGAISTLPDHTPCGSVMEAAKLAGYKTGLVVTTRITDATPACFAAHVNKRDEEDKIAEQLLGNHPLGQTVDLMLGAGRCHFLPNQTEGSCRDDDHDLVTQAKDKGFTYIDNREDFDSLRMSSGVKLPLLGLFADNDIPYDIDRQHKEDVYPSLKEMTELALDALAHATQDTDQGFFLMVEGSRIDHAGHANDPAAQVVEVLAYDSAFSTVLKFLDSSPTDGILVATSDHETGGLSTARQLHKYTYPEYVWYPGVLANVTHSASWLTHAYHDYLRVPTGKDDATTRAFLRDAFATHLGIHDASEEELLALVDEPSHAAYLFADAVSRRAQTGWATHGHSGADVNIYASDAAVARGRLSGSRENTEVGEFLAWYLGVSGKMGEVTERLRKAGKAWAGWMGPVPEEDERLDGQDHSDHYQGDFKKYAKRGCEICGMH